MFRQEQLIEEMPKLERFALKLCPSRDEADDLLQATMLRALEKKELFETDTNLFSWSSKIMYNLFVTNYRRKVKFETQYDPEDFIQKETVRSRQEDITDLHTIDEAMEHLPDDYKTVLVMVCVKGMKYQQVADMLDVPVGTVRSRLSRAREQLQQEIAA